VFNNQLSLWEQLGAEITNDQEVLAIASQLTDEQIDREIRKSFSDHNSTSARHWLQNALRVDPNDRLSIDQLDAKHSLFTTRYASINMDTVITVINANTQQIIDNTNTNVTAIMNKFQELREDIRDEFDRLGDSFNTIIQEGMMMIHGHENCLEGLDCLKHQLEQQRNQSKLDMDAIRGSLNVFGSELSSRLDHSLSAILVASSKDTSSSSEEINNRLDILITTVTNVTEQVSACAKYLSQIRNITSKIAMNQTHYPRTFIILPKLAPEKLTSDVPVISKVANFVNRKVLHPFLSLLWDQSVLLFICPVS